VSFELIVISRYALRANREAPYSLLFFLSVKIVPPPSLFSHESWASIKPARARILARPRPSELFFSKLKDLPLSSNLNKNSPAGDDLTNIFTSVASA